MEPTRPIARSDTRAVHAGGRAGATTRPSSGDSRSLALLAFPRQAALLNEIAILALFAVSLDLILGYGGIVSLGHAAFFGTGAYVAALFAKHVMPDPLVGTRRRHGSRLRCSGRLTSVLVLRGSDLTRLMVTLGVALILYELANRFDKITGGADGLQGVVMGPLLGQFAFDLGGRVAYLYSLAVLVRAVPRRAPHRAFAVRLRSEGDPRQPACAPRRSASTVNRPARDRLHDLRGATPARRAHCSRRRPASRRSTCSTSTARPTCCWCW